MGDYKIESDFEYKGHRCVVLFLNRCFHRCGYVALEKEDCGYRMEYEKLNKYITCHGGITYAENRLTNFKEYGHWWIGFHTNNYTDKPDYGAGKQYFKEDKKAMLLLNTLERMGEKFPINEKAEIRTLKYCENECKKIVDQIIKLNTKR